MPHRGPPPSTKLDFAALMDYGGYETANDIGRALNLSRGSIQQLKGRGIPIMRADELCTRLGIHPCEVWGDDFFDRLYQERIMLGVVA